MDSFKIGKETIVLLKDGSCIVGELMEVSALGVTLKIT
jgi:small nuclear ribonucleoprotein (snRNP)-like protein